MTIQFADFNAPNGLCVATGTEMLPLDSPAGALLFVASAIQSGIGDPADAAVIAEATSAALAGC